MIDILSCSSIRSRDSDSGLINDTFRRLGDSVELGNSSSLRILIAIILWLSLFDFMDDLVVRRVFSSWVVSRS